MALWGNKDSKTANGTITIASTGVVSGSGTFFKTEAKVGNTITAGGVDYTIISITDATTAKVTMGRSNGAGAVTVISSATSYTLSEKPAFISRSESPSGTSFVAGDSNNVYGVDTTEINAGGDNTVNISLVQGGAGYAETPTVTIAAPTALTIATAAVSTTNSTITATAHKLLTGTKLTYSAASNTVLGGLSDGIAFYVVYVDANTFKLATSLANAQAGTTITFTGIGNGSQTLTGDTATATATVASGAVSALTLTGVGSAYLTAPNVTIAAPILTVAAAGITASTDTIAYTAHGLSFNDAVTYTGNAGGLTSGTYYVAYTGLTANAFELKTTAGTSGTLSNVTISGTGGQFTCNAATLAAGDRVRIDGTLGGVTISGYSSGTTYKVAASPAPTSTSFTLTTEAGVDITTTTGTPSGVTFTTGTVVDITSAGTGNHVFTKVAGTTATAKTTLGSGSTTGGRPTHAGWVRRTVGTGNRAGRIQYETLVAMGSISGDAADDLVLPDA